jgi:hypothetical protein
LYPDGYKNDQRKVRLLDASFDRCYKHFNEKQTEEGINNMNKLQVVSIISLLIGMSAQAQSLPVETPRFEYQCQQNPELVGAGTELTVAYKTTYDAATPFTATLVRTVMSMPPQSSTETFDVATRKESEDLNSKTYEGKDFKLTVSENAETSPRIGRYFPATLEISGSTPQELFCKQGPGLTLPAVTGSN